jgi:pyruvate dehydrogenase E2 component (dihydrolipoamide acetyltransferase)
MATDFSIPKMGDNVKEATIVNWLVEDGAEVKEGDEILEVETDKAVFPIPANTAGYLHIGPFKAGDTVQVAEVVATIGQRDEAFAPGSNGKKQGQATAAVEEIAKEAPPQPEPSREAVIDLKQDGHGAEAPRATPVAQKMAAELGVDLHALTGSGERGKITKDDVLQVTSAEKAPARTQAPEIVRAPEPATPPPPVPKSAPQPSPAPAPPAPEENVLERVQLKGIRGVVTRRMAESVHTTARVTLVTEVDATEFVALREQLKASYAEAWGFAPGYNELLAMVVVNGLRQFPYMNARLSPAEDSVEYLKQVNIGIAVDTERGLLVVVLRDADRKGLQQLGADFREMVGRARNGKSSPDDLNGGTFAISNLGMYRVDAFTPVINLPNAAILGVGRITPKPVVKNNEVVVRKMLTLSLVFDHRVVDGAPAARFLDYLCEVIEDPKLLFLTGR